MVDKLDIGVPLTTSTVLTGIARWYMTNVRVPAVTDIRPEIVDAGFWTGVFGGRSSVYLWYHYPDIMTVLGFVMMTIGLFIAWVTAK